MKRLFEPAFNDRNGRLSLWVCYIGFGLIVFFTIPSLTVTIQYDPPRSLAIADAKVRDAAMTRMREACFTDDQIKNYWYEQGFWEHTNRLLVVIRGREALCGGRGSCGCEAKERPKGSV